MTFLALMSLMVLGFVFIMNAIDKEYWMNVSNEEKFVPVKRIRDLSSELTKENEGIKVSVAQVSEILKDLNKRTNGEFYKFVKRGY